MKGKLYGIGAGPGDPNLLTIKAKEVLEMCDIVALPKSRNDNPSTVLNIVEKYIFGKEQMFLVLPMTPNKEKLKDAWEYAAQLLITRLNEGKNIAFVTLGDPSVYSTFNYVYQIVKSKGYDCEIIPGITSFCATAATLGVGLCDGKEGLTIVPALDDLDKVREIIKENDNIVLMKGAQRWSAILDILDELGLVENTYCVEKCGMRDERVFFDVRNMPDDLSYFLTAIIRKRG